MAERKHKTLCIFYSTTPRNFPYEIHEWIHDQLHVSEYSLTLIQIDGTKGTYMYFSSLYSIHSYNTHCSYEWACWIQTCHGENFHHTSRGSAHGNAAYTDRQPAPEVLERTLRVALASYGKIVSIHDEMWSKAYHYTVANGIKMLMIKLTKHLPSYVNIAWHSTLGPCDAQPITCYGCGDAGYMYQAWPRRLRGGTRTHITATGA